MQYPSTPSSSRSNRAPATPPSQTVAYGLNGPGAPLMAARDLPPSPFTPSSARGHLPATPFMGTVPLPYQVNNPYGLLTPPASPVRPRGQLVLHDILTPRYGAAVRFDMRSPTEHIQFLGGFTPAVLDAQATTPGTDRLQIAIFFDTIRIEVTNPRGVTVRDVFYRLYRELSKRAETVELMRAAQAKGVQTAAQGQAVRRIDLLAPSVYFAGLNHSGDALSLVVKA